MAKKKSSGTKKWFSDHTVSSIIIAVVILIVGYVGYNLFLDWRNRVDMRDLLASLEQLEKELEAETDEEFYIDADCGTGGKFSTFYSCELSLGTNESWRETHIRYVQARNVSSFERDECRILSETSLTDSFSENAYLCSFSVRSSNENYSDTLFSYYSD